MLALPFENRAAPLALIVTSILKPVLQPRFGLNAFLGAHARIILDIPRVNWGVLVPPSGQDETPRQWDGKQSHLSVPLLAGAINCGQKTYNK